MAITKEITGKMKQKNNTFPKALKINKKSLHSAEQIANEFNSFLTNVGPSLAKNILPVTPLFKSGDVENVNYNYKNA